MWARGTETMGLMAERGRGAALGGGRRFSGRRRMHDEAQMAAIGHSVVGVTVQIAKGNGDDLEGVRGSSLLLSELRGMNGTARKNT